MDDCDNVAGKSKFSHSCRCGKSSKEWPHPGAAAEGEEGQVGDTGWLWCRSELLKKELTGKLEKAS